MGCTLGVSGQMSDVKSQKSKVQSHASNTQHPPTCPELAEGSSIQQPVLSLPKDPASSIQHPVPTIHDSLFTRSVRSTAALGVVGRVLGVVEGEDDVACALLVCPRPRSLAGGVPSPRRLGCPLGEHDGSPHAERIAGVNAGRGRVRRGAWRDARTRRVPTRGTPTGTFGVPGP